MTTSFADGLSEEEFRRSIEARLRENRPDEAVRRLRRLLVQDAGSDQILPARFLTVQSSDLVLHGWDDLPGRIRAHDEPGRPITAISIAFGWPGEEPPVPDERGHLRPLIEVEFFNDAAYPFSESDRDNLLEGYSYYGCTWAGEGKATEATLTLGGIDDLHGALALLEARLLAMEVPDEDQIRAGSLGACLLSVLLFEAVRDRLAVAPLPRPVCVMAGSNGVYPYFDAPVCGMPAAALKAEGIELGGAAAQVPGPRYSSLLVTGIPRARKRAVLVVEETGPEAAPKIADLRHDANAPADPAPLPQLSPEPLPEPEGPLLVKRKPVPAWDFRDLLAPAPPAPNPALLEPAALVQEHRPIAPGFKSFEIDLDIESRLKALIAEQAGPTRPAPAAAAEMEPLPEPAPRASFLRRLFALLPWRARP